MPIMQQVNIFWFRRDLRINDNHGLFRALKDGLPVLPVFILDTDIISLLDEKTDKRISFIILQLKKLNIQFQKSGSGLFVYRGKPHEIFTKLMSEYSIKTVICNHDYEPYAIERDFQVKKILNEKGIDFLSFKDQLVFEKNEVIKIDGLPYTVFTPYSKRWKELLKQQSFPYFESEKFLHQLIKKTPVAFTDYNCPPPEECIFPDSILSINLIKEYEIKRNFPGIKGTSRLGLHLRFGTLSIRELLTLAIENSEIWRNELIWREFFMQILFHFPHVVNKSFKPAYDNINWLNNEKEFNRWCEGTTGYPMVDAGMRELNESGFMHNRVRMITASFLCKHLLIDWRWGESYFATKLLDFELSSNNGNWQWAAGSGCDAAPYFRVFNPMTQQEKFDPDYKYIKKWIPEYGTEKYPKPVVEHQFARQRCIQVYKEALTG